MLCVFYDDERQTEEERERGELPQAQGRMLLRSTRGILENAQPSLCPWHSPLSPFVFLSLRLFLAHPCLEDVP